MKRGNVKEFLREDSTAITRSLTFYFSGLFRRLLRHCGVLLDSHKFWVTRTPLVSSIPFASA